ncbi:MAG: bifunctional 3-deoxy-7-phosphoheptulonate synthase/chorismate mutase type II [Cytophagaceae bacterium]|nr:bifunctional 3-deoxy-7-phosphoheptulonate synthase/chorismate mutase type II [Cytophagaceae bacterium]MBK9936194.1 bifunctional 3-deoxy-7-phosphoheptulonate synthase/chorismate mutase type II [Cytophagaceae bacterium]MBL0303916.1 bifunctional 3-deoxy-7-phosphoheptulonate synthase/chorismate mutase type II [Cytophagaceae bacterium]MBL0326729.1 bifunctional 3-deoxy-7-phosphoheptulonate synthase/chorismate mutase type II [Cytophagaceae bacterium]
MKANIDVLPLNTWVETEGKPLIIAGPCSAESEEQVMETAISIKNNGFAHILRAGVWKPRTRPGSFEGKGEEALPWLQKAKAETGLKTAVEVATPQHVELALKYGVDVLWIGARTTVNPFNVQDLADSLKGVDIPVLIKNPVNPDLALWVGAFERIAGAGINKMGAIHRGFSNAQETKYRNSPMWQIAVELKTLFPQIPLIGDPSHMAGKRAYLAELTQRAMDLNYDGLIIESHRNPDEAWSDASQQLTPNALAEMLSNIEFRKATYESDFQSELERLRQRLDNLDRELLEVLASRMSVVEQLGEYKRDHNVAVLQLDRWKAVHETRAEWAKSLNLYPEVVEELFKLIHMESIRKQTEVMNQQNA